MTYWIFQLVCSTHKLGIHIGAGLVGCGRWKKLHEAASCHSYSWHSDGAPACPSPLPDMLKTFSLMIGYTSPSSQKLEVMYFVIKIESERAIPFWPEVSNEMFC